MSRSWERRRRAGLKTPQRDQLQARLAAAVLAIKANEAVISGRRIELEKERLELI